MTKSTALKVESSKEISTVKGEIGIEGFNEVPTSVIPVPYYKLVQPGSTHTTMTDGQDAPVGSILMGDSGESIDKLRAVVLRAKHQHRVLKNQEGKEIDNISIAVLGMNLDRKTPFILGVSVASFSNFGKFMRSMKEKGATHSWDFPVVLTTQKQEMEKDTDSGRKFVKFWTINFSAEEAKLSDEERIEIEDAYLQYSGTLDKGQEEPVLEKEPTPF